jgi:hypothetical protein
LLVDQGLLAELLEVEVEAQALLALMAPLQLAGMAVMALLRPSLEHQ